MHNLNKRMNKINDLRHNLVNSLEFAKITEVF